MAKFSANTHRVEPYKGFRFRLKWDGRYVAGVSKCSALKRSVEVIKHREGADPSNTRHMPGQTSFEAITLERGVTHDEEFERWANMIYDTRLGGEMSLKNFRKEIIIELLNENGIVAKAYKVHRCWVSEYQALPELDANANSTAIEMMKLENEGWERDIEVPEPVET